MKKLFQSLLAFLETKSGLVILGFLATTVCGSFLNYQIQTRQLENEHSFEMYKTRLSEAKDLQEQLLENSNARFFYLQQVLTRLAYPEEYKPGEILKYWNDKMTPTKDSWNKDLYFLHAQARVLFTPALAGMLLVNKENQPIVHDLILEKLNEEIFKKNLPRSLHGAFVDTHATPYFLLTKCVKPGDCDRDSLIKLAEKQMYHLEALQSCLAYRLSGELLRYPYGPKADVEIEMPEQCEKENKGSRRDGINSENSARRFFGPRSTMLRHHPS